MTVELTTDQICTVLDALEQELETRKLNMQDDELDEARKDLHTLRGVLVDALVTQFWGSESVCGLERKHEINEVEVWEAWVDGKRDEAVRFLVSKGGAYDIASAGADALGVELSDSINVQRHRGLA